LEIAKQEPTAAEIQWRIVALFLPFFLACFAPSTVWLCGNAEAKHPILDQRGERWSIASPSVLGHANHHGAVCFHEPFKRLEITLFVIAPDKFQLELAGKRVI